MCFRNGNELIISKSAYHNDDAVHLMCLCNLSVLLVPLPQDMQDDPFYSLLILMMLKELTNKVHNNYLLQWKAYY